MSEHSNNPAETTENPLHTLRKLLFNEEESRIEKIEEHIENKEVLAKDIASVLPEAILIRSKEDNKLGKTLAPTIEEALRCSITRDPQPLSDALFPMMGPAIRKSINNAISEMMQSLNTTLDNSFSIQGLKWRLEAKRTGKSFAEVVMLNTLLYRVEQIFLIHKETGLLLKHIALDPSHHQDADVVSSMLTAVQDFIQDSFSSNAQNIDNLRMGDLQIMVESSPDVVLAVVCRGNPPRSLQEKILSTLEHLQQKYADDFKTFDGDTSPFDVIDDELNHLLVQDYKPGANPNKKKSPIKAMVMLAAIALLIAWWIGSSAMEGSQQQVEWEKYIAELQSQPGIMLGNISTLDDTTVVSGLRDPLSIDPYSLLQQYKTLDNKHIQFHMQPYYALHPTLVLQRAYQKLAPPKSIEFSLDQNTLIIKGKAKQSWLDQARHQATFIPGIEHVDMSQASHITPIIQKPDVQPRKIPIPTPKLTIPVAKQETPKRPLTDAEILKLAIDLLQPPATIEMSYSNGILKITGSASQAWIDFAEKNYSKIVQIHSLYISNLTIQDI